MYIVTAVEVLAKMRSSTNNAEYTI